MAEFADGFTLSLWLAKFCPSVSQTSVLVSLRWSSINLAQMLPQAIIGLVPDLPSLASCSLVCQAFLPKSRACIFRHVSFNKAKCSLFLMLCKTSPHIPSLVKSISFSFQSRSTDAESSGISEVMSYLSGVERVEDAEWWLGWTNQADSSHLSHETHEEHRRRRPLLSSR